MEFDDKNSADLEAELYSRIHHDQPDAHDAIVADQPPPQYHRSVTKHSIVNNKMNKKTTKSRKKSINPNPFAIASAVNSTNPIIPKRLTPYTSYLSQVDSKPIDVPAASIDSTEMGQLSKDHRPNPFNHGFNRAEEKMKRYQLMQAKKAQANKIRENNQQNIKTVADEIQPVEIAPPAIAIPDSESDDEVYIYPPQEPKIHLISSEDEEENEETVDVTETIDCQDISVDYDRRLSRHYDPFGGIDPVELNQIASGITSVNVAPMNNSPDHFAKPQRANRHSVKRSYEVTARDFAATDVYESESSDLPECNAKDKSQTVTEMISESEGSDVDITKRSKRMRKRKSSGSNRGSDYISSDDSDGAVENDVEQERTYRPYYLHRGEGVYNAITKYSKRRNAQKERNREIDVEGSDSSEDNNSVNNEGGERENVDERQENVDEGQENIGNDQDNAKEKWIVKDQVGEPDDIDMNLSNIEGNSFVGDNENLNETESHVDKDDANSVRSRRLVIYPEMGWNNEMRAFYNDSWGGETHNAAALRKQMPRDRYEWPIDNRDLKANYNMLKGLKCHNCRESGHRMQFCPQPRKEVVCYTCGNAGHREARCPYSLCLKCGEKTNSYRRGCERCFSRPHIVCKKCRRRGHYARDCPDNWRAYHNTTEPNVTPTRLPMPPTKKFCSACAGVGHRAEQCYDFQLLLQDQPIPSEIREYEKIYKDDPPIDNSMSTPYSMFENPRQNFKFNWTVNESSDRIYGRFLAATKFKRDPVNTKRCKRKRIPKLTDGLEKNTEKLVLNPMNAENMREKPKKQFRKNFYEEQTEGKAQRKEDETRNVSKEIATATSELEISADNDKTGDTCDVPCTSENTYQDVDVEMVDIETPKAVGNENCNDESTDQINELDEEKLMQEAIEVDRLRGVKDFSFAKEMDELNKSKGSFDLSFIGFTSDSDHQPTEDNVKISKSKANKIRSEAEIVRLTEMEISLNKLKTELNKKKPNDDCIVLNVSNSTDQSIHSVHDSDSNYSFGEYFNEAKSKEKEAKSVETDEQDYIPLPPLPPQIDAADMMDEISNISDNQVIPKAVEQAKIFLTKEHARLLLSTEAGNRLLSDASRTHGVKVRMDWENLGNVLVVIGPKMNQNKFHADLIRFLVDICKKMRIRNETFQQLPRSKVALIRFIREQFALLNQPLGNVNELYKNMKRNEKLNSKNGTKNADRARKNLNIILMGRAGLREGRYHLAALENNLKFLLEQNKDMMTKQTREDIYHHYRYIFSPFEHDDYPELMAEYESLKKANNFPPLNIDNRLLEFKLNVKDDERVELNRAKQKLMLLSTETQSPNVSKETTEPETAVPNEIIVLNVEPKTPTREVKSTKRGTPKSPAPELILNIAESSDVAAAVDDASSSNVNEIWSLKCKDIVEKCRQKHIKSSKVVDKLNSVLEKASKNQLSKADYKNLEKILNTLNSNVN